MVELAERIELRCPNGPRKLLGAMLKSGETVKVNPEINVMELSCRDCRDFIARKTGKKPLRVLHYYNILGEHIDDEIIYVPIVDENLNSR